MLEIRELLLLVLFSGILAAGGTRLFAVNAATRRLLIINGSLLFLGLPPALTFFSVNWQVGVTGSQDWPPALALPVFVQVLLPAVGLFCGALLVVQTVLARRRINVLPLLRDLRILRVTGQCQRVLHYRREVRFRTGLAPCSSSFGVATVVLPGDWRDWNNSTLEVVITHELVHLARCDDRWLLLLRVMAAGYWWLPWLRKLAQVFERTIEENCDDEASSLFPSDAHYLRGVLEVASRPSPPVLAEVPNFGGCALLDRFRRFHGQRERELNFPGLYWLCLCFGVVLALGWTVRSVQILPEDSAARRIVAIAAPADSHTYQVQLAVQRGPPVLENRLQR
jgi:hypothetical protein